MEMLTGAADMTFVVGPANLIAQAGMACFLPHPINQTEYRLACNLHVKYCRYCAIVLSQCIIQPLIVGVCRCQMWQWLRIYVVMP